MPDLMYGRAETIRLANAMISTGFDDIIQEYESGAFNALDLYLRLLDFRKISLSTYQWMKDPEVRPLHDWFYAHVHDADLMIFDLQDNYDARRLAAPPEPVTGDQSIDDALSNMDEQWETE